MMCVFVCVVRCLSRSTYGRVICGLPPQLNTTLRIALDTCPKSFDNKLPFISVHCEGEMCQVSDTGCPVPWSC